MIRRIANGVVLLAALVCIFPVVSVLMNSFALGEKSLLLPPAITLGQYMALFFENAEYLYRFWYSLGLACAVTALQLTTSFFIAAGLTHVRGKLRVWALYVVVLFMTMPFQVTLLPNYLLSNWLRIYDTVWAMVVPQIFSPLGIFLLHQTLSTMPSQLSDVALLETSSYAQYSLHVTLPFARPTAIALAVLLFADAWGMVDLPLFLLKNDNLYPLSLLLNDIGQANADFAFAAAMLYMAPMLLIYGVLRTKIIEGFVTAGNGGTYAEK